MANRGYAVFLPNFRASTSYGLRYQRAADGDVGNGRVLSDVIDGLDFLLANGIGDRNRQAVAGHSFGGYASLLAVSHYPQRFLLASVSKLRAPIYLWAGAKDDRTPIKSIAHYAGEARRNGKAVALLIDPDAGHTPVQALGDEAWVFMLESAANRHFGGGVTPASPELSAFVRKHVPMDTDGVLRVTGSR